jgi:hypothetical protein
MTRAELLARDVSCDDLEQKAALLRWSMKRASQRMWAEVAVIEARHAVPFSVWRLWFCLARAWLLRRVSRIYV